MSFDDKIVKKVDKIVLKAKVGKKKQCPLAKDNEWLFIKRGK